MILLTQILPNRLTRIIMSCVTLKETSCKLLRIVAIRKFLKINLTYKAKIILTSNQFLMYKGTDFQSLTSLLITNFVFEECLMIVQFLPSMTELTTKSILTSFPIFNQFFIHVPIFAFHSLLLREERSFVILPIMCKYTFVFIMFNFAIWTEF